MSGCSIFSDAEFDHLVKVTATSLHCKDVFLSATRKQRGGFAASAEPLRQTVWHPPPNFAYRFFFI